MGCFDYSKEPRSDIAFVDMKSFTRVWNVWRGASSIEDVAVRDESCE